MKLQILQKLRNSLIKQLQEQTEIMQNLQVMQNQVIFGKENPLKSRLLTHLSGPIHITSYSMILMFQSSALRLV